MGKFARRSINLLLDDDVLIDIRQDWIVRFYKQAYNSSEFQEEFSFLEVDDDEFSELAITAGHKAENFDPHDSILSSVTKISKILSVLQLFTFLASVLGFATIYYILEYIIMITNTLQSLLLSAIPPGLWAFLMLYLIILRNDTYFVQEFNKKMRFGPGDVINARGESDLLFAYYLWNNGLMDKRKAPSILILHLIYVISYRFYDRIMSVPGNNLEEFIDTREFREVFDTAVRLQIENY